MRKTLPFLKSRYFQENADKILFDTVKEFIEKYNTLPSKTALKINLESNDKLTETQLKNSIELLGELDKQSSENNLEWFFNETEKFCQEKAIYNAIMDSIGILDGKDPSKNKGIIPSLLSDALSISFDPNIGHSYLDDAESRFDYYHRIEKRIPFDLEYFNKITNGGLVQKSLTIAMAGCVHPETKIKVRIKKKE